MNKKQLNRVKNLYTDGVSAQVCIASIIGMSNSDTEASIFVHKFYNESVVHPLQKEISTLKGNLDSYKESMEKKPKLLEGDKKDESLS